MFKYKEIVVFIYHGFRSLFFFSIVSDNPTGSGAFGPNGLPETRRHETGRYECECRYALV